MNRLYFAPFSQNTFVTDRQTDEQTTTTMPIARLLLKYIRSSNKTEQLKADKPNKTKM